MSQTVTTDAPEPREPGTGLGAAFLVALALHAGGLFALTYWRSAPTPPGENEITIDLAPDLAAVDVPNESKDSESTPTPTDVTPPTTVPTAEPPSDTVPVETPPPPETKVEETPQETPVEPMPAEAVPMEKPPEPVTEAVQEPEEQVVTSTAQDAPATVVAPTGDRAQAGAEAGPEARGQAQARREAEAGREAQARGGEEAAAETHARRQARGRAGGRAPRGSRSPAPRRRLRVADERRRRLGGRERQCGPDVGRDGARGDPGPRPQRRGGRHRDGPVHRLPVGRVLGASLAGSSGNGSIDAAAVAAASGSLPPAPPEFTGAQQSFTLPVRFN